MINFIVSLARIYKLVTLMFVDSILLIFVLWSSFSLRLGIFYWPKVDLFWLILIAPVIAIPIFFRFGIYRVIIRYIGFKDLWIILQAVTLYAAFWGVIVFIAIDPIRDVGTAGVPRSVILINWLFASVSICALRLIGRWIISNSISSNNYTKSSNVLIYGAGSAGRQLSIALTQSIEYNPVAFIDDSSKNERHSINGLEVFSINDIEHLIKKKNVTEVLIAIPSLSRVRLKEIIDFLEPYPVAVRSLPSVSELAQGKVKIDDLLEINIGDLLGREPVQPNENLLKVNITDKVVLITGAGGSIGSELCRQILFLKPKKIILFEISEPSLYQIEQELIDIDVPNVEIFPVLGSIGDNLRLEKICMYYGVQTLYHAAAYKHVPIVEYNPSQGILNNAIGTMLVAEAAIASKVEIFVLISTDKAVRPVSTMGVAKRIAELVLQALSEESHDTCFTMVRFGNVIDSSGSVIPLFKKQIREGGPLTVTHANVVRYFMTIPEAVELVIQAGAMGKGGDVFVLNMGEPVRIYDLAVKMIKLSGLEVKDKNNPKGDIEIKYTGLRPGERLYEELLVDSNILLTDNKLIMRAQEEMMEWKKLKPLLNELQEAAKNIDHERIRQLLKQIVPEFEPQFSSELLQ